MEEVEGAGEAEGGAEAASAETRSLYIVISINA